MAQYPYVHVAEEECVSREQAEHESLGRKGVLRDIHFDSALGTHWNILENIYCQGADRTTDTEERDEHMPDIKAQDLGQEGTIKTAEERSM